MKVYNSIYPNVELGNLCKIQIGKTPSRANSRFWGAGSPWVSIADMTQSRYVQSTKEQITKEAIEECGCKKIPAETILLSFKLSIGKVAFSKTDLFTNEAIAALIIKDENKIDKLFLYWALRSIDLTVDTDRAVKGNTLNKEKLFNIKIPLPPLDMQKVIVKILDQAEEIYKKRQESIFETSRLVSARFFEIFGDPVSNKKHFDISNLEDVCTNIVDCLHTTPNHGTSITPYPSLRTSDLQDGYIDFTSTKYVEESEYIERIVRLRPEAGDIVYSREGERYGIAALIPQGITACLGQRTMMFRVNQGLVKPEFFWAMMNSHGLRSQAIAAVCGITSPHINIGDIRKFKIIVPPIDLQNEFSEFSKIIFEKRKKLNEFMTESAALLDSLTYSAFQGKL